MSEPSPIPIDLQPLDLSHLDYDRVHDHAGGAGRSRADLQSTLGGDTPRRDVSSKDSRKLSIHEHVFPFLTRGRRGRIARNRVRVKIICLD